MVVTAGAEEEQAGTMVGSTGSLGHKALHGAAGMSADKAEVEGPNVEDEGVEGGTKGIGIDADGGGGIPDETSDDFDEQSTGVLELMERVMETLQAFGRLMVVSGSDSDEIDRSISMHAALQACVRKELRNACPGLHEALTSRFHGGFIEFTERREWELWRPSVVSFPMHSSEPGMRSTDRQRTAVQNIKLRSSIGLLLYYQGLYGQAEPYLQQALMDCRAELGERHPHTLGSISYLGTLYESQGRYSDAEQSCSAWRRWRAGGQNWGRGTRTPSPASTASVAFMRDRVGTMRPSRSCWRLWRA